MEKRLALLARRVEELRTRRVMEDPTVYLDGKRQEADRLYERLVSAQERKLNQERQRYIRLCASLDAMSPLKVLSRGYSVVRDANGAVVRDAASLSVGERLRVSHGQAECLVENVREDDSR